ncbi:MAG: S8 family serine peptidase [Nitriliruptorales bacterium]|nr:S8 family serine peptidase [Nitriliruptorales bacterium]
MTRTMTMSTALRRPLLIAGLLALLLSALAPASPGNADANLRVIVRASQTLEGAASAVTSWGGEVLNEIAPFGMLVAEVPAATVDDLAADSRAGAVTPDVEFEVRSHGYDDGAVQTATAATAAPAAWQAGYDGSGVGVVLVDTGVSHHDDLGDRLVAAIDLTPEQNGVDSHGHGTFLAGLVAGDGTTSGGENAGVAPGAHLVSVKVAGADGTTALSTLLQGLVAADRARELYDAPVVLLALSGPVGQAADPIMIALEMLWARGSVVVVTAGNDGPGSGSVGSPGADPYLITVGAFDDVATADRSDDVVAEWSSRGPTPWGHAKPDLVAPGRSTIGLRAAGSTIDLANPSAVVEGSYFKGTGTSMAAAMVAGGAAVLLDAQPGLSPDVVKGRLMGSADAGLGADVMAMGAGALDVGALVTSDAAAANQDLPPLPEPRMAPGRGKGEAVGHTTGKANTAAAAGWNWGGWNWGGWNWGGWNWSHEEWTGWNWSDEYWAGWNWSGWNWSDAEWSGWNWSGWNWSGWNWSGWNWSDAEWSGWNWSGWNWSGWNWSGWNWSGWNWSGWQWTGWSWTGWSWG